MNPTIHFRNQQWLVTDDGMECPELDYFIEKDRFGELYHESDMPLWILHVGIKSGFDLALLVEAFLFAQKVHRQHNAKRFSLAQVLRAAFYTDRHNAYSDVWEAAFDDWLRKRHAHGGLDDGKLYALTWGEHVEFAHDLETGNVTLLISHPGPPL